MGGSTRAAGCRRSRPAAFYRAARARQTSRATASPGARPEEARMFTGIVEDLGEVETVEHLGDFARVHVRSTVVTEDAHVGDSICVNRVCLTVTGLITARPAPAGAAPPEPSPAPLGFTADVMGETLRHSSLKSVAPGTKVNLERSV